MDARMAALARQLESIGAAVEAALLMLAADGAEPEPPPPGCRHGRREGVSGFGEALLELCRDCGRMLRDGQEVADGG
ncbi:MAG: hypothetical protein POELPBGB_03985 [Bacteroidia bacterium]|nr:hypothetical protein [Bacteroidia bacterium]